MSDFEALHDTVSKAAYDLENSAYDPTVVYVHPTTFAEALKDAKAPYIPAGETLSLIGMDVIKNAKLPKGVVAVVDSQMIGRDRHAIEFGTVDE